MRLAFRLKSSDEIKLEMQFLPVVRITRSGFYYLPSCTELRCPPSLMVGAQSTSTRLDRCTKCYDT